MCVALQEAFKKNNIKISLSSYERKKKSDCEPQKFNMAFNYAFAFVLVSATESASECWPHSPNHFDMQTRGARY